MTEIIQAESQVVQRPWRRFFARWLDYAIYGCFLSLIENAVLGNGQLDSFLEKHPYRYTLLYMAFYSFVFFVVEMVFYHFNKRTPGKYLFNLFIVSATTQEPVPTKVLKERVWRCWIEGEAFLFPLLSIFTNFWQYCRLSNKKPASYDARLGLAVVGQKLSFLRKILIILMFLISHTPWDVADENAGVVQETSAESHLSEEVVRTKDGVQIHMKLDHTDENGHWVKNKKPDLSK